MVNKLINAAELDKIQLHTKNFRALSNNSWDNGGISSKDKHLIAVAIAQTTNCKHCLLHHAKAAQIDGASFDEIAEIAYLTGVTHIAGKQLLQLTPNLEINYDATEPLSNYTSAKVITYINQQLKVNFITAEIKILALIGIAKYINEYSLVEHFLKLAENLHISDSKITEALLVVDILSTGIIYSNNQDIYNFLNSSR